MERWVSGLNQFPAKEPTAIAVRGFESLPLRHVLLVGPIMNRLIQQDTLAKTCFTVRVGVSNRFLLDY